MKRLSSWMFSLCRFPLLARHRHARLWGWPGVRNLRGRAQGGAPSPRIDFMNCRKKTNYVPFIHLPAFKTLDVFDISQARI